MALRDFYVAQDHDAKAFGYRRELTDAGGPLLSGGGPMAYNDYNGSMASGRTQTPLTQREAPLHMQTYGGSEGIDWLYSAVNYIAQAAASADYHFEDNGKKLVVASDPSDPSQDELAPSTVIDLFKEPNPYMDWSDLLEVTLIDWLIVGNAYWVKWKPNAQGQPLALYRMAPQFVRIIPGQFGPEAYTYTLPGQREPTVFRPEQIVHMKRTNPHDPYYGLGIVKGGARALDMEISLTRTTASYYEKQALPSGTVETERRVPRDVFNKLKSQVVSFYSGSHNAGQLMVLEAGLKYNPISPNAADAGFHEMGSWSRDRVLAMFNLNKALLGMWDSGDDPNLQAWEELFDSKTMIPLSKKLSKAISRGLTKPGWGLDFVVDYELSLNNETVIARAQALAPLPGIKVKELRAAAGLPPSTGDPEKDEVVLNMPGPELDGTGQGGFPDKNLPGEAGRPPLPENTRAIVPPAKAGGNSGKSITGILAHLEALMDAHDVKAMQPANITVGNQLGDPPEDALKNQRVREIDSVAASLVTALSSEVHVLERGLFDSAEGKAANTAYQRVKGSEAWQAFQDRIEAALHSAYVQALSLANIQHAQSGFEPAELDYDTEAKTLLYRKDGLLGILKTLKKRVLDRVLAQQRTGAPAAAIENAIHMELADWSASQTPTIALSEATTAYNSGVAHVADANGMHVYVSDGEDDDAPCKAANGQVWTAEEALSSPIEHPNCRRAFIPVSA